MSDEPIDTSEMLAIHECFRKEFASLPLRVKAVPESDGGRAAAVGGHVLLMSAMLHGHHSAEDELLWPVFAERAPQSAELVETMAMQHARLSDLVDTAQAEATAWMADTNILTRSSLHTTLIALERALLEHLSFEEIEVLPVIATSVTQAEFDAVGIHARASLSPETLAIGLGLILDDNSAEAGQAILDSLPPEARAGFEEFGRPAYVAYRDRLLDNA